MAQVFRQSMTTIVRVALVAGAIAVPLSIYATYRVIASPWYTREGEAVAQTVPFSHEHHVRGLGLDCRYCHTSVEQSSFAGIPPTKTCMTCHSKIWYDSPMLAPVRESWSNGTPLVWNRVHALPGYVYFEHDIHVAKGVGCNTCHGQVERMPLMMKGGSLQMAWCLECHRNPERYLRPREEVFNMEWRPPANQVEMGRKLVEQYHVQTDRITNCSTCHR